MKSALLDAGGLCFSPISHPFSLVFISTCLATPFPSLLSSPSFLLPFLLVGAAELQSVPLLARSPSTNRKYPPLHVDKLEEEMNRRMADDNKLFREEFNVRATQPLITLSPTLLFNLYSLIK